MFAAQAGCSQSPQPPAAPAQPKPVGVCVRYDPSSSRLSDAVVVVSSGDPQEDAAGRTAALRGSPPVREVYDRDWFGVWVGEAVVERPAPDCTSLERSRPK
jgi:hypothetical protein